MWVMAHLSFTRRLARSYYGPTGILFRPYRAALITSTT